MNKKVAKVPPKKGRPTNTPQEIRKARKGHVEKFTSAGAAGNYYNHAKRLGRNPTRRTIDGVINVYLDSCK